jgi:hypothetical protein
MGEKIRASQVLRNRNLKFSSFSGQTCTPSHADDPRQIGMEVGVKVVSARGQTALIFWVHNAGVLLVREQQNSPGGVDDNPPAPPKTETHEDAPGRPDHPPLCVTIGRVPGAPPVTIRFCTLFRSILGTVCAVQVSCHVPFLAIFLFLARFVRYRFRAICINVLK